MSDSGRSEGSGTLRAVLLEIAALVLVGPGPYMAWMRYGFAMLLVGLGWCVEVAPRCLFTTAHHLLARQQWEGTNTTQERAVDHHRGRGRDSCHYELGHCNTACKCIARIPGMWTRRDICSKILSRIAVHCRFMLAGHGVW